MHNGKTFQIKSKGKLERHIKSTHKVDIIQCFILLNNTINTFQPPIADIAIADVTITTERAEVVDFTMPFMKLGNKTTLHPPK